MLFQILQFFFRILLPDVAYAFAAREVDCMNELPQLCLVCPVPALQKLLVCEPPSFQDTLCLSRWGSKDFQGFEGFQRVVKGFKNFQRVSRVLSGLWGFVKPYAFDPRRDLHHDSFSADESWLKSDNYTSASPGFVDGGTRELDTRLLVRVILGAQFAGTRQKLLSKSLCRGYGETYPFEISCCGISKPEVFNALCR
jgi:hypothetical protein